MDETSRRGGTKHRTSEERTPVGTQSAEGRRWKCDQRDPGSRRDELPQAPRSFLAHFSVSSVGHLERTARPARSQSPQCSTSICLKITFSGSTGLLADKPADGHSDFLCLTGIVYPSIGGGSVRLGRSYRAGFRADSWHSDVKKNRSAPPSI